MPVVMVLKQMRDLEVRLEKVFFIISADSWC